MPTPEADLLSIVMKQRDVLLQTVVDLMVQCAPPQQTPQESIEVCGAAVRALLDGVEPDLTFFSSLTVLENAFVQHVMSAFGTSFPTQPKPGVEWWARTRELGTWLQAKPGSTA